MLNNIGSFYKVSSYIKILTSISLLLFVYCLPINAHSSGGSAHLLAGIKVKDSILKDKDLKHILNVNFAVFYAGLNFPDYAKFAMKEKLIDAEGNQKNYCDFAHLQNKDRNRIKDNCIGDTTLSWANEYAKDIIQSCIDENKTIKNCQAGRVAFLFGALTHMVTDAYFDYNFVGKGKPPIGQRVSKNVWKQCFQNGEWEFGELKLKGVQAAEAFTDQNMERCLNHALNTNLPYPPTGKGTKPYDNLNRYCKLKENKVIKAWKSPVSASEVIAFRSAVQIDPIKSPLFPWRVPYLSDFNKMFTETMQGADWKAKVNLSNAAVGDQLVLAETFQCFRVPGAKICNPILQVSNDKKSECKIYLPDLVSDNTKADKNTTMGGIGASAAESAGFILNVYNEMVKAIESKNNNIEITRETNMLYRLKKVDGSYFCAGEPRTNKKVRGIQCQ